MSKKKEVHMADVRPLILLRNDPRTAAKLLKQARMGDVDAQYALALVYAEGRGVATNLVLAFFWLSLADAQGDADASQLRLLVAAEMSIAQHDDALCLLKNYREQGELPNPE